MRWAVKQRLPRKLSNRERTDILAVKNKQPGLAKVVRESFESSDGQEQTKDIVDFCETQDDAHRRTEIRRCTVLQTSSKHPFPPAWKSVAAMIRIESERSEGGKITLHTRYFISSTWMKAKDFLEAIGHIGASKTICIGSWMSRFEQVILACELKTRPKTS